jgi:CRP/FNR family cyclic AMP-dependent transcriptional regulator
MTSLASQPATNKAPSGEGENAAGKKSGFLQLNSGQILFQEGDKATSLYIIQKGQLRLFRPKGKGFIELAVLRPGEVVGEMAYFAVDDSEALRSCTASALVPTEVIEISFVAFSKTMSTLNPWFKTIIQTLATRLRKTNARVKELESNSVAADYAHGGSGYKFFRTVDVVKILSMCSLVCMALGETSDKGKRISSDVIKFFAVEVYNIEDVKVEEFIQVMKSLNFCTQEMDKDGKPKILVFRDALALKNMSIFLAQQRVVADNKKMKVNEACEQFLGKILDYIFKNNLQGPSLEIDLKLVMAEWKEKGVRLDVSDLEGSIKLGLLGEIFAGKNGELKTLIQLDRLKTVYPPMKLLNVVDKFNASKANKG